MASRIYQDMKPYIASRRDLQNNGYPLNGYGFLRVSGTNQSPGAYAIDCEMCTSVKNGSYVQEVIKISVVDHNYQVVYENVVRPRYQVSEYNTAIHGISASEIQRGVSLDNVHKFLERNFYSNTIIVGHSLEHDFKALNLIHETVADVSLVYPKRPNGQKYSLKDLAERHLGKYIQRGWHHDSTEDARIAMELMRKK